jgi:hypothetical protein
MDLILKTRAIYKLRPGTEWTLDEHKGLSFITEGIEVPTDAEIEQAAEEILADDAAKAQAKTEAQASGKAKLAALGLDADEISALIS